MAFASLASEKPYSLAAAARGRPSFGDGLVVRTPCPKDRRSCRLSLTDEGRVRMESAAGAFEDTLRTVLVGFRHEELVMLTRNLTRVAAGASQRADVVPAMQGTRLDQLVFFFFPDTGNAIFVFRLIKLRGRCKCYAAALIFLIAAFFSAAVATSATTGTAAVTVSLVTTLVSAFVTTFVTTLVTALVTTFVTALYIFMMKVFGKTKKIGRASCRERV